jgi:spore coat protein U-like protein
MLRLLKLSALSIAALILAHSAPAVAASATSTLTVKADVIANCTIDASKALDFGNIDVTPGSFTASASTTISVACTKSTAGTSYKIYMRSPTNSWKMVNGAESLPYALTDQNGVAWDETHPVSYTSSGKAAKDITVKGTILSNGYDVSVGSYSDSVTAEIQF